MKKEDVENIKSPEEPSAPKPSAKAPKEKKKKEKQKLSVETVQLPVLVELTYSASTILLIFVSLAVIIVSVLTGASLLNLVIRTSVAILVMGSLLILIFSQVSSGMLQASLMEQEESQKAPAEEAWAQENPTDLESHEMAEA